MNEKHRGILVPMATPFTAAGTIDEAAVRRIMSGFATNGIHCLLLGTTGEAPSIPQAERDRFVQIAVDEAGGRVLVYAGIADNCAAHSVAAGNRYLQSGVDAVVALLPSYYALTPVEMEAYFRLIASEIDGPLGIYNIPSTTHHSIPVDVVEEISHISNVIAYKDSENNVDRIHEVARRLGGREDFSLFVGVAAHSTLAMKLGFDGSVPSSGNLNPSRWRDFLVAADAQNWAEAAAIQAELDALSTLLQKNRTLGQSLAALKAAMHAQGLCEPHMMPPLQALPEADVAELLTALADFALPVYSGAN